MRRIIIALLIFAVGLVSLGGVTYAQEPVQPPVISTPGAGIAPSTSTAVTSTTVLTPTTASVAVMVDGENLIRLSDFKFDDRNLRGPFDFTNFWFGLPAGWAPAEGVTLHLHLDAFFEIPTTSILTRGFGGILIVRLNDEKIGTILLDQLGEQIVSLPVPASLLSSRPPNKLHELAITLETDLDCDLAHQTSVLIRASSGLDLPHQETVIPVDLSYFPYPIYQRTFLPDEATLVIPDQPAASDLTTIMNVAAGLGRITEGKLAISIVPVEALSPEQRDNTHLIFIGQPASFPALGDLSLPLPIQENRFELQRRAVDDSYGIVQMVVSPWNRLKAVLVVSGNSPEAVLKAGQAVSSGAIRPSGILNVALITKVQPDRLWPEFSPDVVDRTLAELGYENRTFRQIRSSSIEYQFEVSTEQAASTEAYFELIFSHSKLLDYERSGLYISLNDELLNSVRLSDETAQEGRSKIPFPFSTLRPGRNQLVITADLIPLSPCIEPDLLGTFLTVNSSSLLHLPPRDVPMGVMTEVDLGKYPLPFSLGPGLNTTAFVLPANDLTALNIATQIATDLGRRTDSSMMDLAVAYAHEPLSEEIREQRDLIVIGRPSALTRLLEMLNEMLPAPFYEGSDIAVEHNAPIIYHVLPGTSIGYLEMALSPWNKERLALTVLGSTNEGLEWAGRALLRPDLRGQLLGDFAAILNEQIFATDTRLNPVVAVSAAATAAPVEIEPPLTVSAPLERPDWLLNAILAGISLMLVVLVIAALAVWRQRRVAHF